MASKTESLTITNSKKKVATSTGSTVYYNFYSTNSNYGVKGTIDTLVRQKIPKYSTINAASLTAKFSDAADLANIYYNIIYGNYGSNQYETTGENNEVTRSENILNGIEKNGSNVGLPAVRSQEGGNNSRFLGVKMQRVFLTDTELYYNNLSLAYTFTYPTYTINYSVASLQNNKGESLTPGSIAASGFEKGKAFDIDVASNPKSVSMTASANTGYTFSGWMMGSENKGSSATLSLSLDDSLIESAATTVNYVANFSRKSYTISTTSNNSSWGSTKIDGGSASKTAPYKDKLSLSAHPVSGYYFEKWSDGNTSNPRTVSVDGQASYQAIFQKYRTLNVTSSVDRKTFGEITVAYSAPSDGIGYRIGETVTLSTTAVPASHTFGWYKNNSLASSSTSYSFAFVSTTEVYNLVAKYFVRSYLIEPTINFPEYGNIEISYNTPHVNNVNGNYYDYGTQLTLKGIPNETRAFVKWVYNGQQNLSDSITFLAQDYQSAQCNFRKTYVTYDSLFSTPKWVEHGVESNTILCSADEYGRILLTNKNLDGTSSFCPVIEVDPNQIYRFECDASLLSFKIVLRYCNTIDENGTIADSMEFINLKSFSFQPSTKYLSIGISVLGERDTAITFSNLLLYLEGEHYSFMRSSVEPQNRSNDTAWKIPAPSRAGYRFLGWFIVPEGEGDENDLVFPPGAVTGYDGIEFPSGNDMVLYSHWDNVTKVRFRVAKSYVNMIFPSKNYNKDQT